MKTLRVISGIFLCTALATTVLWWRAEKQHAAALVQLAALRAGLPRPTPAATTPAPPAPPATTVTALPGTRIIRAPSGTTPEQYVRAADQLIEDLNGTVAQLRRELAAALQGVEKAVAENNGLKADTTSDAHAKLSAQFEELKDRLLAARDNSAAIQAELKIKSDRLNTLETGQKAAADRLARAEATATRTLTATREIDDLNRRREVQIANLQRRYREVTDVYRAFALDAQNREHAAAASQAGDISRIQTSIQQAEDDLRQIQVLNARIAQLQGKP